jgi:CheY-like chemotaxis protein
MTTESVFIVTEGLPAVGETVNLRLSFPRAVRPLLVSARVLQIRMSTGPGNPSGFVGVFEVESEEAKKRIADIAQRLRRPTGSRDATRKIALLLVEENKLIRDMFAYAVERYFGQRGGGIVLAQAPTVAAAWQELDAKGPFDLALIDYKLPEESGAAFITKLRAHAQYRRMSIVGMSVGGAEAQRAMLAAGADIFLHKPIVLKDLFCTLEFLMDAPPGSDRGAA